MVSITSDVSADVDLERRVANFLAARHLRELRELTVVVRDGVVVLRGRVSTFYVRQLASACCRRVAGVSQVIDHIFVVPSPTP